MVGECERYAGGAGEETWLVTEVVAVVVLESEAGGGSEGVGDGCRGGGGDRRIGVGEGLEDAGESVAEGWSVGVPCGRCTTGHEVQ